MNNSNLFIVWSGKTYKSKHIFLFAFVLLLVSTVIALINTRLGLKYPYTTFLLDPLDRFGDFFKVIDGLQIVDTWKGIDNDFVYYQHILPFSASLYLLFAELILLVGNKYIVLTGLYVALIIGVLTLTRRAGNTWLIIILAIISYPMLFAMDRGNLAILVFLLIFFSLKTDKLALSTLAIAIATSIKLSPVVFLLPILVEPFSIRRTFKGVLFFLGWIFLFNFIVIQMNGNLLTPHVFSPITLLNGILNTYNENHVKSLVGLIFGSSLYMPTLYIAHKLNHAPVFKSYELAFFIYAIIGFCLLIKKDFVGAFHRMRTKKNIIFFTCISFVLLMPVTGDYYLLILFIPLLLYPETVYSFGYFIALGLLLSAKNFLFVNHTDFIGNSLISLQVFINPILLLGLLLAEFNLLGFLHRDRPLENNQVTVFIQIRKGFELISSHFNRIIKPFELKIFIFLILAQIIYFTSVKVKIHMREIHNQTVGLPVDFDPESYLKLNPQLEEYWNSVGIKHESKQSLFNHAELHYLGFGFKDKWRYK